MNDHRNNRMRNTHWLLPVLAACVLLLGGSALSARPDDLPGPGPLFRHEAENPVHLAVSTLGGSASSSSGRWAVLANLYAGTTATFRTWNLDGPMSAQETRRFTGGATLALNGFQATHGVGSALTQFGTLVAGAEFDCWRLIDTDKCRPLPENWHLVIVDGRRTPMVRDKRAIPRGHPESEIYINVLIRSYYTSARGFRSAVRKDLTFNHLNTNPDVYRGEVVRAEGRLKRINRYEPPLEAQREGVSDLYEAWIFPEWLGAQPYCVIFTGWPEGLSRELLGQPKIEEDIRVYLDGYFFKIFGYESKDTRRPDRTAPLLIGKTLHVFQQPARTAPPTTMGMSVFVLGLGLGLAGMIFGAIGLTYWFRRGDDRIRKRILNAHAPEFIPPEPDAPTATHSPDSGQPAPSGSDRAPFPRRMNLPAGYSPSPEGDQGGSPESPEAKPDDPPGA